jgi:hypothetical protein
MTSLSPLCEMGAGRGYWGSLLAKRGADYIGTSHRYYIHMITFFFTMFGASDV